MTFKFPEGDLKWVVLLWMLFGVGVIGFAFYSGTYAMAGLGAGVFCLALGICYQIRACAWILLGMLCLQSVRIVVADVIMAENFGRLLKVALNIWFVSLLFRWLRLNPRDAS